MARLSIFLKSGQTITLDGATAEEVPGTSTKRFKISSRSVEIVFLDQEEIAAIISEPSWS